MLRAGVVEKRRLARLPFLLLLRLLQERCGAPACDAAAKGWGGENQRSTAARAKYTT